MLQSFALNNQKVANSTYVCVRIDKWLWAARFFKTIPLARIAIEQGRVLYNHERIRANQEIQPGATLTIIQGQFSKSIKILKLSSRRKRLEDSLSLFQELSQHKLEYQPKRHNHHYKKQSSLITTDKGILKKLFSWIKNSFSCKLFSS